MDTYSEHVAEPKSDRNAATATGRRSEADVDYVASSQKELERERCWERWVIGVIYAVLWYNSLHCL